MDWHVTKPICEQDSLSCREPGCSDEQRALQTSLSLLRIHRLFRHPEERPAGCIEFYAFASLAYHEDGGIVIPNLLRNGGCAGRAVVRGNLSCYFAGRLAVERALENKRGTLIVDKTVRDCSGGAASVCAWAIRFVRVVWFVRLLLRRWADFLRIILIA